MRTCECGSEPIAYSIPRVGGMVELRCPKCGLTTGYTSSLKDAKEHWEHGDVATFPKWMKEMASE